MDGRVDAVEVFIARWQAADGRERANYQLFLTELAALLDLPAPEPAGADDRTNAYVFERRVVFRHGDGSESYGYIDLYRRGAFVLEAKDVREASPTRYDEGMLRARSQAENYARALPADEGRPPFVVVVDVGRSIELYSEFSRSGATYTPYPDPRTHRIGLSDLRDASIRERLRALWLDPAGLDPARRSAIVTRAIAAHLAELARSLEAAGHAPHAAAGFLTRCLFTMFAEDVGLVPANAFRGLLESLKESPAQFVPMVGDLWRAMDAGLFSVAIRADLLRFNGKLFKQPDVLPLDRAQIGLLIESARADWREVEPAIFGTLLERALEPTERHALGAHYTPRAYVERLVLPTVIEPLREDWKIAQATALTLAGEGRQDQALAAVVDFHQRLCAVRVLDPACGSGNFLYVTLEHMKRLEGEVLNAFDELDPARQATRLRQGDLALDASRADPFGGETVDPHQLLGIELNPRAAAIAELVLWIGYLQWHFRTRGAAMPPEPVLKDFRNIECRDAVLAWDRIDYQTDAAGRPLTRWDGRSMKASPVTGQPVPDETARVPLERYVNPRRAAWPEADFVVGNPPFIGNKRMRLALGDGYVEALRAAWPKVPDSADFVMYWWHHAATLTRHGALRRFGLITTNSIRQTFNRRVVEAALAPVAATGPSSRRRPGSSLAVEGTMDAGLRGRGGKGGPPLTSAEQMENVRPISLVFAIPDHPWVDAADGAAVRIAMTVGATNIEAGRLLEVAGELPGKDGEMDVDVRERRAGINSDLTVGADVSLAKPLRANAMLALRGITLVGMGFVLSREQAEGLRSTAPSEAGHIIKPFFNGRDITQTTRDAFVIDFFGLTEDQARTRFPAAYQWVFDRVRPEREQNARASYRDRWWVFAEPRGEFRLAAARLKRYIATPMTAKHRIFLTLPAGALPDQGLVPIALDDSYFLGTLSSRLHIVWALQAGGTLEDRPRYNQSTCFETFPFPAVIEAHQARIRALAEQLDAHRKRQQAAHPGLTLTGIYNVLEKLRSGEILTPKERTIHEQGLVSVLRQLHDELDRAVLDAYGWSDLAPLLAIAHGSATEVPATEAAPATREAAAHAFDEAILERLIALNAERATEERRGLVRWLRPEFQNPQGGTAPDQLEIAGDTPAARAAPTRRQPWPKDLPDQVRAVADVLAAAPAPVDAAAIAVAFSTRGRWQARLPAILETLVAIGRARRDGGGRYAAL
ncbi:MAG: class I SAM-dependent DNA methyltransferase [Xanthomonadales bacterium]|nr:class I SAM-dependent DNA methyltransferase [Xanthomonadales bacterium]